MEKISTLLLPANKEPSQRRNAGHSERTFEGRVTPHVLRTFLLEVHARAATCTGEGMLLDFTKATLDLHFNDMLALTEWESTLPRKPFTKLAIVVDNMVSFGLARMYETLASDLHDIQVFRGKAEAAAWLRERA